MTTELEDQIPTVQEARTFCLGHVSDGEGWAAWQQSADFGVRPAKRGKYTAAQAASRMQSFFRDAHIWAEISVDPDPQADFPILLTITRTWRRDLAPIFAQTDWQLRKLLGTGVAVVEIHDEPAVV